MADTEMTDETFSPCEGVEYTFTDDDKMHVIKKIRSFAYERCKSHGFVVPKDIHDAKIIPPGMDRRIIGPALRGDRDLVRAGSRNSGRIENHQAINGVWRLKRGLE